MKKIPLLVTAGVLIILIIWVVSNYNGIVTKDENVNNAWSKVESAYQRRADLIPNLVNTVENAADYERNTLEAVIKARAEATSIQIDPSNLTADAIQKFQAAQSGLSSALSRLLVTVERYPDLKANQNYLELQSQLEGTENRIKVERDRFNDVVTEFNTSVRTFPGNITAGLFGFEKKGQFEADKGTENAPVVPRNNR